MKLQYPVTNETLEAIMKGLNLQPNDRVLSICDSGDPPLAILEFADSVLAVDYDIKQIDYLKKRKKMLKDENFTEFLNLINTGITESYQSETLAYFNNLKMIVSKLEKAGDLCDTGHEMIKAYENK